MPQDFSRKNLRGRSFKNQDLTGAKFIYADIQGADFTGANLTGANFSNAKAGLQLHQTLFLLIISLILSVLSGMLASLTGVLIALSFNYDSFKIYSTIAGAILLILIPVFLITTFHQGITAGVRAALLTMLLIIGMGAGVGVASVAITVAVVGMIGGWLAGMLIGVLIVIAAAAVTIIAAVKGAVVGAVLGAAMLGGWIAIVTAAAGVYFAWRVLVGDEQYDFVRIPAISFTAMGGTRFCNANLADTNFTGATLKSTDFRGANLINTCWKEVKKLDRSRVDNSILAKKAVRELLVSGNGYQKSYVGANLRGANLAGANLREANLKEADINLANLKRANLEGADLTKVQAISTDFTNAYLTGACLESWTIHNTTKLKNVDIRFFYILEEPDSESEALERCPSSGEFSGGEFIKLFASVLNSVDLVFQSRVNWQAFGVAFKEVQVINQCVKLFIRSIENPSDGVVVINVGVTENANRGEIQLGFTQSYEVALKAIEAEYEVEHRERLKDAGN